MTIVTSGRGKNRLRAALRGPTAFSDNSVTVDLDQGVIRNAAVLTQGDAKGHPFQISADTVAACVAFINSAAEGIRCRFRHPDVKTSRDPEGNTLQKVADDTGTMVGRVREEINRLLREGHDISADERAKLEGALKAMDTMEAAEKRQESRGVIGPQTSPFSESPELKFGQDASREAFGAGARQREQNERRLQEKEVDLIIQGNQYLRQLVDFARAEHGKDPMQPAGLSG
ncbi:MAG TPA: hypothetical protein VK797_03150 [Tepidisphaeraceae bacterium]|nr:hypothetical protein [Tepidisphaeraceae bacterium]